MTISWISNWNPAFWTMTQYLCPILFLGTWVPFAGSFLTLDQEISSFRKTFPSILFGSILIVLGALLLNQRLFFVILDAISGLFLLEPTLLNEFIVNVLIVGMIAPANEEFMKVIPILVVAQAPIVFFNPEKSDLRSEFEIKHSIKTLRQFGFYGIVSGTVFTFLELFLYQWSLIDSSNSPESVFLQLLFRTLTPLHVLTTFLLALGVGSLKIRLAQQQNVKASLLINSGYFLLGWGLHSLWNIINVYYYVYRPEAELELYTILVIYGMVCVLLLFFGILLIFRTTPKICPNCGLEEQGIHPHKNEFLEIPREKKDTFPFKLITHISPQKLRKHISCPFCLNPLILGTCSTCGASSFVTCPHCSGFISETTSLCPHCNKKIQPLIELQMSALTKPETIILGITSLASIAFLLAPISLLIFGQLGVSIISPILIFYFIMSITIFSNVIISLFFNRTSGMLTLFCYFLELALLILVILSGFVIIGFLKALSTSDLLSLGMVCLGGVMLCFIVYRFVYVFIFNYSPVFPEYRLNQVKEVN
ncbi:MAG: PrsW family glutamic-type intramembrane protease [Candidatus Thorarchaeota archaeon]